jgi:hypothetical protein
MSMRKIKKKTKPLVEEDIEMLMKAKIKKERKKGKKMLKKARGKVGRVDYICGESLQRLVKRGNGGAF